MQFKLALVAALVAFAVAVWVAVVQLDKAAAVGLAAGLLAIAAVLASARLLRLAGRRS